MPKQKYKKRADGRYARQVVVGKTNDGKPVKKTVYGYTEKELDRNYRELMLMVDKGIILKNDGVTISELYDEWYRIKKQGKIKANTVKSYRTMSSHLIATLGNVKAKDVTLYHIESMIANIENKGHSRMAMMVLNMTKAMMQYAVRNDIIVKNPCLEVNVNYRAKEKRALTEEEKTLIDNNINKLGNRQKMYLLLLRYTGMRKGEVLALSKQDIDKKTMMITINKTLVQDAGLPFVQDTTKTKAGSRKVPIFLPLAKPLFEYIDSLQCDYLFMTKNGKHISISQLSDWTEQIRRHIGLSSDITNHSLRHNFISECYNAKVDLKKLQKWIGHANISTTLNIYTHLSNEEIEKSEEMNDYYTSQKEVKPQNQEIQKPIKLVK